MDVAISVKNLSKRYWINPERRGLRRLLKEDLSKLFAQPVSQKPFWALKDVSFTIKKGQTLGIIGSNGAGKSTLLKILSRVTYPTSGQAILTGKVSSLLDIGVGFHPELTGRENIFLNGVLIGFSRSQIKEGFTNILDFSGIGKFIDTPVKYYSSGMYLRLAFSIATTAGLEPDILLLDEILAVGDASFYQKSLKRVHELAKNPQTTTLFVSHNLEAIKSLCQRVIWLEQGRIKMIGSPQKVIKSYLNEPDSKKD